MAFDLVSWLQGVQKTWVPQQTQQQISQTQQQLGSIYKQAEQASSAIQTGIQKQVIEPAAQAFQPAQQTYQEATKWAQGAASGEWTKPLTSQATMPTIPSYQQQQKSYADTLAKSVSDSILPKIQTAYTTVSQQVQPQKSYQDSSGGIDSSAWIPKETTYKSIAQEKIDNTDSGIKTLTLKDGTTLGISISGQKLPDKLTQEDFDAINAALPKTVKSEEWAQNLPMGVGSTLAFLDPKQVGIQAPSAAELINKAMPTSSFKRDESALWSASNIPSFFAKDIVVDQSKGTVTEAPSTFQRMREGFVESTYGKVLPKDISQEQAEANVKLTNPLLAGLSAIGVDQPTKFVAGASKGAYDWARNNPDEVIGAVVEGYAAGKIFGGLTKLGELGKASALADTTSAAIPKVVKGYDVAQKAFTPAFLGTMGIGTVAESTSGFTEFDPTKVSQKFGETGLKTALMLGGMHTGAKGYSADRLYETTPNLTEGKSVDISSKSTDVPSASLIGKAKINIEDIGASKTSRPSDFERQYYPERRTGSLKLEELFVSKPQAAQVETAPETYAATGTPKEPINIVDVGTIKQTAASDFQKTYYPETGTGKFAIEDLFGSRVLQMKAPSTSMSAEAVLPSSTTTAQGAAQATQAYAQFGLQPVPAYEPKITINRGLSSKLNKTPDVMKLRDLAAEGSPNEWFVLTDKKGNVIFKKESVGLEVTPDIMAEGFAAARAQGVKEVYHLHTHPTQEGVQLASLSHAPEGVNAGDVLHDTWLKTYGKSEYGVDILGNGIITERGVKMYKTPLHESLPELHAGLVEARQAELEKAKPTTEKTTTREGWIKEQTARRLAEKDISAVGAWESGFFRTPKTSLSATRPRIATDISAYREQRAQRKRAESFYDFLGGASGEVLGTSGATPPSNMPSINLVKEQPSASLFGIGKKTTEPERPLPKGRTPEQMVTVGGESWTVGGEPIIAKGLTYRELKDLSEKDIVRLMEPSRKQVQQGIRTRLNPNYQVTKEDAALLGGAALGTGLGYQIYTTTKERSEKPITMGRFGSKKQLHKPAKSIKPKQTDVTWLDVAFNNKPKKQTKKQTKRSASTVLETLYK